MTSYPSLPMVPALSVGCLKRIIKSTGPPTAADVRQSVVQILGTKRVANGSIRCILWDGVDSYKMSIIKQSPENDAKMASNQFQTYSVVRLINYWVSTIGANDAEVLVISQLETLMTGSQINCKLDVGPQPTAAPLPPPANTCDNQNNMNNANNEASIDTSKVCPILAITPFFNAWLIRARVVSKTAVRTYKGRDGKADGRLFSFDVADDSADIRFTAFNKECDKYFDIIEKDMNYYFQRGSVKSANRKYSNLKSDYEITLNADSVVVLCNEAMAAPPVRFRFTAIAQLEGQAVGDLVDVIGVVRNVGTIQTIVAKKTSIEYRKRDVSIVDKTLAEVRLTLWSEEADGFCGVAGQVMAIKNAIVGEFNGKTLKCAANATTDLDPDLPEAHILKGWYDREMAGGGLKDIRALSKGSDGNGGANETKYLCQINEESVPEGQTVYYNCKATVVATNRSERHMYKSCANTGCSKKVREENNFYYCEKCKHNSPQFEWRLMISLSLNDPTGDHWVTAFQEVAEKITGKPVAELSALYESSPDEYQSLITSTLYFKTFVFRIGSRIDVYNDERRVKSTCFAATPLDPIQRSKELIEFIKSSIN
ncbi:unnamed protein product [Medioppia subpectinata]|uniref:Replication protein A subunit n=1 Tax=Medioppia subpectinata TaxID=1979941 RepID=A0A7R9KRL7_9ACAR|nr:unnamed protein product [Medioppia subpectinata]CAG2107340.1 unnamed protein product [Medioppia subpectinata]